MFGFGTCRIVVQSLELYQHLVGKNTEGDQILHVKGTKPEEDNLQMDSGQAGLSSLSLPVGRLPSWNLSGILVSDLWIPFPACFVCWEKMGGVP